MTIGTFRANRIRVGVVGAREPWRWPMILWHPASRKAFDREFGKPWWRQKMRLQYGPEWRERAGR